jgi:hypothetical protein
VSFLSLLAACATIPKESVDLSSEVGIGLQKQHQSQIDLVNLHFSIKRKSLDAAMSRALDTYFETLAPSGSITLNRAQLGDVADDVMSLSEKNNAAKEELEEARVLLSKKLNENYLILNQANSSVTGLLQSAVTVKEARSEAYKKLSESTSGKIDLGKIFSELDDFVLKGGEEAGKAIKLADKLESILKEKEGDK